MSLRIGIDFHVFDGKYQGSRTHLIELYSEIIDMSPDMEFYLFLAKPEELRQVAPAFSRPNVKLVAMPQRNPFVRLFWQLPRLARQYKLDLMHTQYILPWPLPSYCRSAVTIHDILFESHPQFFSRFFVFRSRVLMYLSSKVADYIFTVSDFSKREIISRYHVDPEKISVIFNGVDAQRFHPGSDGKEVVSQRGLTPENYFLSVGRLDVRKNHINLIRAYLSVAGRVDLMPRLVIIGQPDYKNEELYGFLQDNKLSPQVEVMSDVSDDELPALYRHALAFVFPTLAEGFGMPLLEAMASGTPVISSNTTAMPEVVADTGWLFDPTNSEVLGDLLEKAIIEPDYIRTHLPSAMARAKFFSWANSAKIVRDIYQRLCRS